MSVGARFETPCLLQTAPANRDPCAAISSRGWALSSLGTGRYAPLSALLPGARGLRARFVGEGKSTVRSRTVLHVFGQLCAGHPECRGPIIPAGRWSRDARHGGYGCSSDYCCQPRPQLGSYRSARGAFAEMPDTVAASASPCSRCPVGAAGGHTRRPPLAPATPRRRDVSLTGIHANHLGSSFPTTSACGLWRPGVGGCSWFVVASLLHGPC